VPNAQYKTPDDGQRNCPKHAEFLDKINLGNSPSVVFIKKKSENGFIVFLRNFITT
jgi:hypothetical protein